MFDRTKQCHNEDFKEQMILSGQDMLPSAEFKARLLKQIREKIRTQPFEAASPVGRWRKYVRVRIPLAAASLLIVVGCLWVFFGHPGTASADFGEMLRQVREVLGVAFTASLQAPGEPDEQVQVYFTHTGQARLVRSDGRIDIIDALKKKYLTITPSEKRAAYRNFDPQSSYYIEPIDTLRRAADTDGVYLRDEVLQGKKLTVYQVMCGEGSMTIWVDQETQLPYQIQRNLPSSDGANIVCTLDRFQWNISIPDAQFALDVPEGYVLENTEQEASESDLIFLLRVIAEKNNGFFPKDVQPETVIRTIYQENDSSTMRDTEDGMFISKTNQKTKAIGRRCFKGLAFIRTLEQSGNWHYVGRDVELDNGESIVCYWSSPSTKTFRVIYGDLTVKELSEEDRENILRDYDNVGE